MKLRHLLTLLSSAILLNLPVAAQTFVGSDDFASGSSKWSYEFRLTGTTGLLSFTNDRLDFSKDIGAANHFRGWDGDGAGTAHITPDSFTTSWVADLTVTNTLGSLTGGDFATIGFQVTDSNSSPNYFALMLSATSTGNFFRVEGTGFTAENAVAVDNSDVFLRMAWDAGAQTLNSFYSVDGSTYTQLNSFNPMTPWSGGNLSNGFWFETFGNSNLAGALAVGSVYADNFSVSAIPEPSTYAALAGLGALGLALWRRRQTKSAA